MLADQQEGDTMGEFLGKRVVPRHEGEWDKTRTYEPLMIVLDPGTGDGYISRYDVPAGTLLTNEHYWAKCSHFHAQMHRLETDVAEDVEGMHRDLADTKTAVSNELVQTKETVSTQLQSTENRLTKQVASVMDTMQKAESQMNDSVDMLTKRLDANVIARTNANADYAAELVDSRVDYMGQLHENAGTAIRKQIQGVYHAFGFGESNYPSADRSDMVLEPFTGKHFYVANNDVYPVDLYIGKIYLVSAIKFTDATVEVLTINSNNEITNSYGQLVISGEDNKPVEIVLPRKILLPAGERMTLYCEKSFSTGDSGIVLKMKCKDNPITEVTGFVTSTDNLRHKVGDLLKIGRYSYNASVWFAASVADFPFARLTQFMPIEQEIEDARINVVGKKYSSLGEAIRAIEPFIKIDKQIEIDSEQYQLGTSATTVQNLYANDTVYPTGKINGIKGFFISENEEKQDFFIVSMNPETLIISDCKWVYYMPTVTGEAEEIYIDNVGLNCVEGDCLFIGGSTTGAVLAYAQKIEGSKVYGFFPKDKNDVKPDGIGSISQNLEKFHLSIKTDVVTSVSLAEDVKNMEDQIKRLNRQIKQNEEKQTEEIEEITQKIKDEGGTLQTKISDLQMHITENQLLGKKIVAIGDSMTYGHSVTGERNWLGKIAVRNKMTYVNYGRNGCYLSYNVAGGTYPPEISVVARYGAMDDDADYVLVFAGTNDASAGIDIGTEDSTDNKTFMGALNEICEGLQTKYPKGKIGFITPYRRNARTEKYAEAIETICTKYGIPVFNNVKNGGINFLNAKQKEALTLGDNLHLNEAGMEVASWKYEAFIRSM